jgi:hypothetical protein
MVIAFAPSEGHRQRELESGWLSIPPAKSGLALFVGTGLQHAAADLVPIVADLIVKVFEPPHLTHRPGVARSVFLCFGSLRPGQQKNRADFLRRDRLRLDQ